MLRDTGFRGFSSEAVIYCESAGLNVDAINHGANGLAGFGMRRAAQPVLDIGYLSEHIVFRDLNDRSWP